jgi:hypothetical protein
VNGDDSRFETRQRRYDVIAAACRASQKSPHLEQLFLGEQWLMPSFSLANSDCQDIWENSGNINKSRQQWQDLREDPVSRQTSRSQSSKTGTDGKSVGSVWGIKRDPEKRDMNS